MVNKELASIFSRMALYLHIDEVPFKPQAYEKAADVLESLSENVEDIYKKDGVKGLMAISGIGKAMSEYIEEYLSTRKIKEYERLRKKIPVDIEELTRIEGVGPKMVRDLYKLLRIKTLKELEGAAKAGKIRGLPNFGEKTEKNILEGIDFIKRSAGRVTLSIMYEYVDGLVDKLETEKSVKQVALAGSLRRMKETVGDVDILVATGDPEKVIELFLRSVSYKKIWGKGETKVSVHTEKGFDIDLRVLPEDAFGAGLQYFTGSKEHNVRLRAFAVSKGYKLNEYGLYKGKKVVASRTEATIYEALGMPYIEPELREDQGEIDAALHGSLPKLVEYGSLRGDLQIQTDWTDGKHSIEEMAKEAKKQGLEYIAITDHTRDLAMTGGSDEKKLARQMKEIDKVNKKMSGITVLKGAEVNIRKDGSLDIADDALAKLDVVGISVHSNFKMSKKDMTARIVRAMQNNHVDILFHPTGRVINKREAYEVDIDKLIAEAKKTGTVLEINASERLDLKDTDIKKAVEAGAQMAINSDAHSKEQISNLQYGIAQARRGWAERRDIINTFPVDKMLTMLKK
jgi:DNA polymerase (family X)